MRVDRFTLEKSVQILKTMGLVPPQYVTDSLWSTGTATDTCIDTLATAETSDAALIAVPKMENAIITLV